MPSWGIHLLVAKKIAIKLNIKDDNYNDFLIGNIIPDINNGYLVENVSKLIPHHETHYYSKKIDWRTGKMMFYDVEKFLEDNKNELNNYIVLGYASHIMTDAFWNNLAYEKHGIFNEKNELIGLRLNNGESLIGDNEIRRKNKVMDFEIFLNYIYVNNLVDIPKNNTELLEKIKNIKSVDVVKEDIDKAIEYLDKNKINSQDKELNYKIFTQEEMLKSVDECSEKIIKFYKEDNLEL